MNEHTSGKSRHARADWFLSSRLKLRHLTVLLAIGRTGSDLESISGERTGSLTLGCNFSSAGHVVPKALLLLKHAMAMAAPPP